MSTYIFNLLHNRQNLCYSKHDYRQIFIIAFNYGINYHSFKDYKMKRESVKQQNSTLSYYRSHVHGINSVCVCVCVLPVICILHY